MQKTKISVIIPCRNEEKHIKECLNSVINNDYSKDLTEIFVIDGNSEDETIKIVENFERNHTNISLLHNQHKTVPFALNLGIEKSKGDLIIRLDAHSSFPPNYFSMLVKWHTKVVADNIGGVCITDVKNKNKKSESIKKVLSNRFGVGNSLFRTGVDKITETDTVPFGCFRKDVFVKYGKFNEQLTRNQDIEMNKRIKNKGGKVYIVPDISCTYFARENFRLLSKNNFQNGLWNILTVYFTNDTASISLRHFIPLLFVISILFPLIAAILYWPIAFLSVFSLLVYSTTVLFISYKINDKTTNVYNLVKTFFVLHFSYGVGSLVGIFKLLIFKILGVKDKF